MNHSIKPTLLAALLALGPAMASAESRDWYATETFGFAT